MPESLALVAFLEASVRLGVPLALAAMGETITERSGVINIGLEGSLIGGALGGALGALAFGSAGVGVLVGGLAGMVVALVFAAFAIGWGRTRSSRAPRSRSEGSASRVRSTRRASAPRARRSHCPRWRRLRFLGSPTSRG